MSQSTDPSAITFEQLAELREKTERLSQFLTKRLKGHIGTLSPVLDPRRIFGRYIGGKQTVPRADEAYAHLAEKYREVSGAPFDLRSDLDDEALGGMENGIEVYPWQYTHEAGGKLLTMTSPIRWLVTYRSDYSISEMRSLLAGSGERRTLSIRRFVINALSMQIVMARNPGAVTLLEDLRYDLHVETAPGLGKLSFVTLSSRIQSFRPSDELILAATRLSGVPAFIEPIHLDAIRHLQDPLRLQLEKVLGSE